MTPKVGMRSSLGGFLMSTLMDQPTDSRNFAPGIEAISRLGGLDSTGLEGGGSESDE